MNAHVWLERATRDLPAGVAGRVSRETRAHLQDAELPEGADVREVLGDAELTNDELRRLYLTRGELEDLRTGGSLRTGLNLSEWLLGLVLPVLLLAGTLRDDSLAYGSAFAVYVTVLALTWNFHPVRRRNWRVWTMLLSWGVVQWVPDLWRDLGGDARYLWLVLPLFVALVSMRHWRHDARLRRTLLAEEGRA